MLFLRSNWIGLNYFIWRFWTQ